MAIRIECPHCGSRSLEEWIYGEILDVPKHITDDAARQFDRAFMHNNREGAIEEAWFHLYGCRRWVRVTRNTTTDEVLSTE